ncbi:MAG: hypothetical protein ACTHN5_02910, partial [Phycisphaerae bacterium]
MNALATVEVELMGESLWWAAVVGAVGVAVMVYAWMVRREFLAEREGGGRGERLRVFGFPLETVSMVCGVACLLAIGPILFLAGRVGEWAGFGVTVVSVVAGVFLIYRRVYRYLTGWRMGVLFGLRALGLVALAFLLFEPVVGFVRAPEKRPVVGIVVDGSGSMGFSDAVNEPSRYLQGAIAVQDTLVPRLGKAFDVQIFVYDGKHAGAVGAGELRGISPEGEVTDLGAAVGMATGGGAGRVILISDGIHNGGKSVAAEFANPSVPVDTVRVGSSEVEPSNVADITVAGVEGPETTVVNNGVTLAATIKSTAMSDRTVRVMLESGDGKQEFDEQRLVLRSGAAPQVVKLKFTPEKVGRATVRVRVPVDAGERSAANNEQEFSLLVTDPKLAVLYVAGRVRPEVGPLRRMLEQDPNVEAVTLVQTQAGKFDMQGVKAGDDLRGLPTTLAQWKRFKVVILGDLDASFLNAGQQRDLEDVVREGAGVLMIGGQNSFAPGGWGKTALAKVLPVSLESVAPAQINTKFVPELTAEGRVHAIFGGIAGYFIGPDGGKPEHGV